MSGIFKVPFVKMHGLGNDFILIDDLAPHGAGTPLAAPLAIQLGDRRFGIGADQILWLRAPRDPSADLRMEILNADGSVAEMCGNGIRAVALYFDRKQGEARKPSYRVETLAGIKTVSVQDPQVVVDMGEPGLGGGFERSTGFSGEVLEIQGEKFRFYEVSMGNPHAVIFVDDFADYPVGEWGPLIERHPRFPKRTNVEFVRVMDPNWIQVKVWERGAGQTLACGTGACAAAVASLASGATGRASDDVRVELPGGSLYISWKGPGQPVMMKGPAVEVFRGELNLNDPYWKVD